MSSYLCRLYLCVATWMASLSYARIDLDTVHLSRSQLSRTCSSSDTLWMSNPRFELRWTRGIQMDSAPRLSDELFETNTWRLAFPLLLDFTHLCNFCCTAAVEKIIFINRTRAEARWDSRPCFLIYFPNHIQVLDPLSPFMVFTSRVSFVSLPSVENSVQGFL